MSVCCTIRLITPTTTSLIALTQRSPASILAVSRTLNCANERRAANDDRDVRSSRTFFNFVGAGSKKKNYARRELVGYSMEQMYSVVSDVENYHKFVPFCNRSVVLQRTAQRMKADMAVGFPPVHERYTSHVTLSAPHLVRAECVDGRLFNYLSTTWRFGPGLPSQARSCVVDFRVAFEFRSSLHSHLANVFFDRIVLQMESAFYREAARRYGKATISPQEVDTAKA